MNVSVCVGECVSLKGGLIPHRNSTENIKITILIIQFLIYTPNGRYRLYIYMGYRSCYSYGYRVLNIMEELWSAVPFRR